MAQGRAWLFRGWLPQAATDHRSARLPWMAHLVSPGLAGNLHWLPVAVVAMQRPGTVRGWAGSRGSGPTRRLPSATSGSGLARARSGSSAQEAICSCIRSDQAAIDAIWVSSQSSSPAGCAASTGVGSRSARPSEGSAPSRPPRGSTSSHPAARSTSSHSGGAGGACPAGGPSRSASSVSSVTGRWRAQRVSTMSPQSTASSNPVISHTMRVPYPLMPNPFGATAARLTCDDTLGSEDVPQSGALFVLNAQQARGQAGLLARLSAGDRLLAGRGATGPGWPAAPAGSAGGGAQAVRSAPAVCPVASS